MWIITDLNSIILLPCHFCLSPPFLHWTKPWPILFYLPQWLNRISHLKFRVVFELSIKSIGISANYPGPVGFTGEIKAAGKMLSLSPICHQPGSGWGPSHQHQGKQCLLPSSCRCELVPFRTRTVDYFAFFFSAFVILVMNRIIKDS